MSTLICCVRVALLTAAALAFSLVSFAQSDTSSISGFLKDATASAVPNAAVVVTNEGTGVQRRTTSNETGYYVVSVLPSGYYTVSVEATGFKRFLKTRNKLDPNLAATVDIALEVGALTESVQVVASVAQVQSESATVGKLIESNLLDNMQLNGRNPLFLALLKAGVRGGSLQGFNFTETSGGLSINGSRTEHNLITMDGAVATRTRANDSQVGVSQMDTVQEIQILTTNYNAEYGRTDGGQIRIVTKSGTKIFHGSLYDYFRNSALNANTWVRNRTVGQPSISGNPEAFRFNQFGFVFGGPVYIPRHWNKDRNKLFFLVAQEYTRFRQEVTASGTVPSGAMRRGDFSELLNPANTFFGRVRAIRDPASNQPYPNNVIPQSQLSPNGLALLNAFPAAVPGYILGTANYIAARPQWQNQRLDTISIDVNPAEKHYLRFRNQRHEFDEAAAFRTNTDRAPQTRSRPNQTYSLSYTWTVTPSLVNELILTTAIERNYIQVDTRGDRYRRSTYGINYPYLFPADKEIYDKIPTIDIAGFVSVDGGPYPASSTGPVYVASDNVTKIHGGHTFKAGFSYERGGENDFDQINVQGVPGGTNNQNGRFIFDDTRSGAPGTGLAVANAVTGLFTTYAEIGSRSYTPYRSYLVEYFVQDSWKATSKLRLELGLRHSIFQPFYSLWRNMVMFDPRFYDPSQAAVQDRATGFVLSGDRYNGLVIPGEGWPDSAKGRVALASNKEFDRLFRGVRKEYSQTHYRDFQPRVGVAYQIGPKTVIRSGIGSFVNRQIVGGSVFPGGNPPLQPMVSIANASVDNPSGGKQSFFPLNVTTRDPVYKNPTSWAWNLTFERAVGFETTLEVGYVGRRGFWLERERNINQLLPGTVQANPGVNPDVLRPYKGLGPLRMGENAANSRYNGLQIGLNRRFTKGLAFGFAYTLSKSDDNSSNYRELLPNNFDDRNFWGPATYDTRHVVVINFVYAVPLFKDRSKLSGKLLGGWQLTGVTQFQTGTPFTVTSADDFAGVGPGSGSQYWNKNADATVARGDRRFSYATGDGNYLFRVKNADGSPIFTAPGAGTFGNQTRNTIYNAGFQNWNLALFKEFSITERQRVQFRFETYNWLNHPNWGGASADPRSGAFGTVTSKSSDRQLQLSLRYSF